MENLLDRIVVNPQVMVGNPVIKGTRLTVQHIVGLLAGDATYGHILEEYPHVKKEDISACLLFAQQAATNPTLKDQPQ